MSIAGTENGDAAAAPFDTPADRWLAQWRDLDFSWDGLAKADWSSGLDAAAGLKRWRAPLDFPGSGQMVGQGEQAYIQANLQDYWRWSVGLTSLGKHTGLSEQPILLSDEEMLEAGLLVEWDGRLWHILHRPDKTFTNALNQDTPGIVVLDEQLKARFRDSHQDFGGADGRVQLVGARANKIDLLWRASRGSTPPTGGAPVFLRCEYSDFNNCNASHVAFGPGSQFTRTRFTGVSDFSSAKFGKDVKFDQSIFGEQTDFFNAKFRDNTSFERAIFGKSAQFRGAVFGAEASFRHTRFGDLADFGSASFRSSAHFRGCHFGREASFSSVDFGPQAEFRRTQFGDIANFSFSKLPSARFRGIDFRSTNVQWTGATLDDCEFAEITYDRWRLRRRCEGLKGGGSIWGDALLRRDLQDQDYIDTLDSRMMARQPQWKRKPVRPETFAARSKRLALNLYGALRPDEPRNPEDAKRIWAGIVVSSLLVGSFLAAVVNPSIASWLQSISPAWRGQSDPLEVSAWSIVGSVFGYCLLVAVTLLFFTSWFGRRAVFNLWAFLGFGRDWDRVAILALILIGFFGIIYHVTAGVEVEFAFREDCEVTGCDPAAQMSHWFDPWFVAAMGFVSLGVADVAEPMTGLGQLIMIANVLAGFTIFGLLLAVLGNRFARRS